MRANPQYNALLTRLDEFEMARYDANTELVDLIHGITYEIWEERGVELIHRYYAADCEVRTLGSVTTTAQQVVENTHAMLAAFPDRLLLAENVVWSDDGDGCLSSHRIMSPMTNTGASGWGPATGRRVFVRTIADCFVQEGKVTEEWLVRDTLPLIQQLGFNPTTVASELAATRDATTLNWLSQAASDTASLPHTEHEWSKFAADALTALWISGDNDTLSSCLAHYVVGHPTPIDVVSGDQKLAAYYEERRRPFSGGALRVDHLAVQPWARLGHDVAVRWGLVARHTGEYLGQAATGRDVYLMGISHWRVVNGRIVADWTMVDQIALLAQLV